MTTQLDSPGRSVGRQVLADEVYDRLMTGLIDGRLGAGAPLIIGDLAHELGVSQTPIREALTRLELTGLVTRVAFKGYRVAPPFSLDDLRQLSEARRVIEPANAWIAAGSSEPELWAALEGDISALERAPRGPSFADFREYWEADESFHRRIAEHTGNTYLFRAYTAMGGQLLRYRLFGGRGVTDFEPTYDEHKRILDAIRRGDPDHAREAMDLHISNVWDRAVEDSKSAGLAVFWQSRAQIAE